jgi:hypothetical protein
MGTSPLEGNAPGTGRKPRVSAQGAPHGALIVNNNKKREEQITAVMDLSQDKDCRSGRALAKAILSQLQLKLKGMTRFASFNFLNTLICAMRQYRCSPAAARPGARHKPDEWKRSEHGLAS